MTIERPNGRQLDDIVRTAIVLESQWTHSQTWEGANHFTCSEVEALADLLSALGAHELARNFIESHSHSDEPGDAHYVGADG